MAGLETKNAKPAKDEISEYVNHLRTIKNMKVKTLLESTNDKFFSGRTNPSDLYLFESQPHQLSQVC